MNSYFSNMAASESSWGLATGQEQFANLPYLPQGKYANACPDVCPYYVQNPNFQEHKVLPSQAALSNSASGKVPQNHLSSDSQNGNQSSQFFTPPWSSNTQNLKCGLSSVPQTVISEEPLSPHSLNQFEHYSAKINGYSVNPFESLASSNHTLHIPRTISEADEVSTPSSTMAKDHTPLSHIPGLSSMSPKTQISRNYYEWTKGYSSGDYSKYYNFFNIKPIKLNKIFIVWTLCQINY